MKNVFFRIRLTDEQCKALHGGGREREAVRGGLREAVRGGVRELVAVDFVKTKPSETDRGRPSFKLTEEQMRHIQEVTKEDPRKLRITWRPALQSVPSQDVKRIENLTLFGCDTWSVPTD